MKQIWGKYETSMGKKYETSMKQTRKTSKNVAGFEIFGQPWIAVTVDLDPQIWKIVT